MRKWMEEYGSLWKNKYYRIALILTAIFAYGYLITHETVGIDDTPYRYYFEEGLAAVVGRWVMFLLNKVVHVAEFAPFITEAAAVLIFMAGVTVWCMLLRRILGERVPMWGYTLFSCLFLSNPLISEVFTYYLHNGVATGYLFSGLSLCCFWEGIMRSRNIVSGKVTAGKGAASGKAGFRAPVSVLKAVWKPWLLSALCLWIAMGCYESFMIVYLTGCCVILCTSRLEGDKKNKKGMGIWTSLFGAACIAVIGILLRSLMVEGIIAVFGLEGLRDEAVQRSVTELAGWIFEPEARGVLGMIIKRVFVMYGVFGYAYYPIKIYVLSAAAAMLVCLWQTVRQRDPWIFLLAVGSILASYLLIFIEGKATLYRSAQFLPMFSAWGLFLAVFWINGIAGRLKAAKKRIVNGFVCVALLVILWNQCSDMNHWFYVDDMKYRDAVNTADQIAHELEKNFDISKPVIFTGTYSIPKSIIRDAYVDFNTEIYFKMKRITDLIDKDLLDKFNREYGVWIAQTPSLSVLEWGRNAFGNDEELIRFFAMHGHQLRPLSDEELYAPAEEYSLTLPSFPEEGAIVDMGDYIIVHF